MIRNLLMASALGAAGPMVFGQPALPPTLHPQLIVSNISFAEGPAFDQHGNLFFVNYIHNGTIGRRPLGGQAEVWIQLPDAHPRDGRILHAFPFGLKLDEHDNVLVADYGGRRLLRISKDKQLWVLADSFAGVPFNNPNDLCFDRAGNVYFSDPHGEHDPQSVGAIYRYSKDGQLTLALRGLGYPNGLAVSPDQTHLYVADTWTREINSFEIGKDGALSNSRTVCRFATPSVDGICLDEFGRVWVARLDNATVDVVSPDGAVLASYGGLGARVTNLAWWDRALFVTVAGKRAIYQLDIGCRGAKP